MKTKPQEAKKTAKTLKGQLFGALSMMLVASIALGTSTYAWFINNRTVEVEDMQLTVSTSTSLLVALGKKDGINSSTGAIANWTGPKSLITNEDITGLTAAGGASTKADVADWTEFLKNQMVPASITSANLAATTPQFFATNNHVTNNKLDEFEALGFDPAVVTSVGQGAVKRLSLRFTSSNDIEVYFGQEGLANLANLVTPNHVKTQAEINELTDPDKAAAQAVFDAETKQAQDIQKVLRLAVVPQATASYNAAVAATVFQFDDGTVHIANATNNTEYGDKNAISANEATGLYAAIATVDANKHVATTGELNTVVPMDAGNKYLAVVTNGEAAKPNTDPKPLFALKADEPRVVDVYVWLEGTDMDCLNAMSGYKYNLNLPFAAVLPTA